MKLDAKLLRYMSNEEFRVLTAVEMGSKNHEVVPTCLIAQISKLKNGGTHKILGDLAKNGLVARVQNAKYDGYRLTYGGYDYLALHALSARGTVFSVGNQIGVGKESDIYIVADEEGRQYVLKMHRLGRASFRAVKSKRDYLEKRKAASWMYMSRLAAAKEFAFMQALHAHAFPVPAPVDHCRHCVVMELVDGVPLTQVSAVADAGALYADLMALLLRLAAHGLVHGDFNEFNLLVREADQKPILIDFPQMISTQHANAHEQFDRDVNCVRTYFRRKFDFDANWWPEFDRDVQRTIDLDAAIAASGACKLTKKQQRELDEFLTQERQMREQAGDEGEDDESDEEEGESEDDEACALDEPASSAGAQNGASVDSISATLADLVVDAAENGQEDEDDGGETLDAAPNNRAFRAFRDTESAGSGDEDGGDNGAGEKPLRAPRLVRAQKAMSADEIKRRVTASGAKRGGKGASTNLNKTRNHKDKAIKETIQHAKADYF